MRSLQHELRAETKFEKGASDENSRLVDSSVAEDWLHKPGVLGSIPGGCRAFHDHIPLFCLTSKFSLIYCSIYVPSKKFVKEITLRIGEVHGCSITCRIALEFSMLHMQFFI